MAQHSELDISERVRIVLVGTTHPGNIGASARAMKVMGLTDLWLVSPAKQPNAESFALAAGADDVLEGATEVDSLAEALSGCSKVFGTTARARSLAWPILSPRAAARSVLSSNTDERIAFVFGREHSGLSNDEVSLCQQLIRIPTAVNFSSLNLAQAVQVCAYEIQVAALGQSLPEHEAVQDDPLATHEATERLFNHWISVMTDVGYLFPDNPRLLPQRTRRILAKAKLTVTETQICRGFLSAIEKSLAGKSKN